MNEPLCFRCPRCGEYVDFQITRVHLDQDFIEVTTYGDGLADPRYLLGPLTADIDAQSGHSC